MSLQTIRERWKERFRLIHGSPDNLNDDHNLSESSVNLDADWWLDEFTKLIEEVKEDVANLRKTPLEGMHKNDVLMGFAHNETLKEVLEILTKVIRDKE